MKIYLGISLENKHERFVLNKISYPYRLFSFNRIKYKNVKSKDIPKHCKDNF